MTNILNKNLFLTKEHIWIFKAANNYDVYDDIQDDDNDSMGWGDDI